MAVRLPRAYRQTFNGETGWDVPDCELREQMAQPLGTLGSQVEQALAALRAFDDGAHGSVCKDGRDGLLDEAADRVWAFMIQRELWVPELERCREGLRHSV